MTSIARNSLLTYLTAQSTNTQSTNTTDGGATAAATTLTSAAKAKLAATSQAALDAAGSTLKTSTASHALDKQQTALATDLRAAMTRAGVKLTGSIDFSVSSDGKVAIHGSDADQASTTAFLKADTSRPGFATRIATQAKNALKLSTTIQQNAAISQAARYGGSGSGVMSLYSSLMQSSASTTVVFSLSAASSSLSYPGSLATKA